MDPKELRESLAATGLCKDLSAEELTALIDHGELRDEGAGTVLIEEGADSGGLLILLEGTVDVNKGSQVLASLDSGAILGEEALLDGEGAIASVKTTSAATFFYLSKDEYFRLAATNTRAAWKMAMAIARAQTNRLQRMNERVIELTSSGGTAELARFREKLLSDWDF